MKYRVINNSYAHASPYHTPSWLAHHYGLCSQNIFDAKVSSKNELLNKIEKTKNLPEIMIFANFPPDRAAILSACRDFGINTVHGEDGFFPHYSTMHIDPLGFCWESSIPRMVFRQCTVQQKARALEVRKNWLAFDLQSLPPSVKKPFVFWPIQLIGDQVNKWDLKVNDWCGLIRHFRASLPVQYQLVLKAHPRSKPHDNAGIDELISELPNTIIVPAHTDVKTLLKLCCAAAGANSSVLYEARLMFHKPSYVYAKGWYTNHTELFISISYEDTTKLKHLELLENNTKLRSEWLDDYADWFLSQLLARQISRDRALADLKWFKESIHRRSYLSFLNYGEEIFLDVL